MPDFEMETPMLVMPFTTFLSMGKINKSTADWRTKAFAKGWLVEYSPDMICIFVSHRWWTHNAEKPDQSAPDFLSGKKVSQVHTSPTLPPHTPTAHSASLIPRPLRTRVPHRRPT